MARAGSLLAQGGGSARGLRWGLSKKRLIAGDFQQAVRAILAGEAAASCSREECFEDIFEALGDAEAQDRIRKASPDKAHCKLLTDAKFGASFCAQCPNNPRLETDLKTGPKNPRAEMLQIVEDYGTIADEVLRLAMAARYGMAATPQSYVERELTIMACYELELAAERRGQDHLAQRLAEMMAAMFGGRQ